MNGRLRYTSLFSGLACLLAAASPAPAAVSEVPNLGFADPAGLEWDPVPGTSGYHLYRGDLSTLPGGDYGGCLQGSLQGTAAPAPDAPPPGDGFFYLVGGYDVTGPGTVGNASSGAPRTPAPLCTANRRYFELIPGTAPDGLPSREPLTNPAIEEWPGSREWSGVLLHSGEFTLAAVDPVGGAEKPGGAVAAPAVASGGARFFPGRPISALIASGGARFFPGKPISALTVAGIDVRPGDMPLEVDEDGFICTGTPAIGSDGGMLFQGEVACGGPTPFFRKPASRLIVRSFDRSHRMTRPGRRDERRVERCCTPNSGTDRSILDGVERRYRSQIEYDGPLGHGWDFSANSRLQPDGPDVAWLDGAGRRFLFHRISPTQFVSPMGLYAKLYEEPSGFHLRFPDGRIRVYHAFDGSNRQGALESEEDLNGHRVSLLYDSQGLLTTIVDDLGRAITLTYDSEGRIGAVSDFTGRAVEYGYGPEGNLVSVRSPLVTGTPNGNDFPLGKTTLYGYSSGHLDERLNHNLLAITSPKENLSAIPFLENTYETDPNDFAFDRVETQSIGGTGSDGIPSGGALSYTYLPLNLGGDPLDMALPRREVTVVDRNGNERLWVVNAAGNPLTLVERTNRGLRPGEPDYVTQAAYNADGELESLLLPEGNEIVLIYDRPGTDRYREGDVLEARLIADAFASGGRGDGHGGELTDFVWSYVYDPVSHRYSSATDPLGRTTTWTLDHQEGDPNSNGIGATALRYEIDLTGVAFNLGDLNGDGATDQAAGNPVVVDRPTVNLEPGSNQAAINGDTTQEIRTLLTWNDHGQITSVRDPEENLHLLSYHAENDPDGDGTPTPAPPDGRTLDTLTGGYLRTVSLDTASAPGRNNGTNPPPVTIDSDYEYDQLGSRISAINGRGVRTTWIYNQLDQVVEMRRASATRDAGGPHGDLATGRGETGLTPWAYRLQFFYDENDNLVERWIEEMGGSGGAGAFIETRWTHEILDNITSREQEVATGSSLTTTFRYDANENLVLRTWPVGNADEWIYDERDLLLSATRGASGPRGGTASTRLYAYDGNENLSRLTDGRGGLIDYEYDGADRLARHVDQVGNTSDRFYDEASNVAGILHRGPAGGPTPPDRTGATNVDLMSIDYSYDELNRLVRTDAGLYVASGTPPVRTPILDEGPLDPVDGKINRIYEYDRLSRTSFVIADSAAVTRYDYDGAGRRLLETDAAGNTLEWTWDDGGNPVELVETEHPSSPGPPAETFLTTWFYDSLDRLTTAVDNIGQTRRWIHDSLDLVETETDPEGPPGGTISRRSPAYSGVTVPVNAHGNVTEHEYDGAGRLTGTVRILTASGEGDGTTTPAPDTSNPANPDGLISSTAIWDDNSLPAARVDDKGNTTTYEFDNLNRLVALIADDATEALFEHDEEDNLLQSRDPNGSLILRTWDPAHRLTQANVVPAPGVPGSTLQEFQYDGLSRLTYGMDQNDPADPNDDVTATFTYDSIGRVLEEHQTIGPSGLPQTTTYGWLAEDLRTDIIGPSSGHAVYAYDGADRLVSVTDGPMSAAFEYFGASRLHTRSLVNGVRSTMLDDSGTADIGYDEARRVALLRHLDPGNLLLAGYEHLHDRSGNRLSQLRLHHSDPNGFVGDLYEYDSAGRLTSWQEAVLDPSHVPVGPSANLRSWLLDGAGNWDAHAVNGLDMENTPNNNNEYDELQGGGTRVDDGIPDDFADLPITPVPDGVNLRHDMNGNQTFDGTHDLLYDAFGRLVEAVHAAGGVTVTSYSYDPLGRRATRTVANRPPLDETRRYLYAGPSVIEERDGADLLARSAVIGRHGRDWLWQVLGDGTSQYLLQDAHGSTVALADGAAPDLIERVTYTPYGAPLFTDPNNVPVIDPNSGLPTPRSTAGNPILFAGMRHDPEMGGCPGGGWGPECGGLYVTRFRYYSPFQGRFLSRDPLGVWADPTATGNGYAYAGGNPVNRADPLGLGPEDEGTLDLPAGPFVRVEVTGLSLEIPGQTLSGDFMFEQSGTTSKTPPPRLKKLRLDLEKGEEILALFNPKELVFEKRVPWKRQRRGPGWEPPPPRRGWFVRWIRRAVARQRLSLAVDTYGELPPNTGIPRKCTFSPCTPFDVPADAVSVSVSDFWGADRTISAASYDF